MSGLGREGQREREADSADLSILRSQAERRLAESSNLANDLQEAEHELLVHQAELEIQNEELRGTQTQLEASRREYFALYDLAPVGYLTLDERGVIKRINLTGSTLLGVDRSRLIDRPFSVHIANGGARDFFEHIALVLGTKVPAHCELALNVEGGTRYVSVRSDVAPASKTLPSGVFMTLTDITERVRATEALEDRERRLRAIFDHAPIAIVLTDEDGAVLECNREFEHFAHTASPQIIGKPLGRFGRRQPVKPNDSMPGELWVFPGGDEGRVTSCSVSRPDQRHGRLYLIEDITEGRKAREREAQLRAQLDEAHQEKLRALGQLAGGIAHDFNNMLAVIVSLTESSLSDPEINEVIQEDLEGIRGASLRARELVKQVLAFARKEEPHLVDTDLGDLVRESLDLLRRATPAGIRIQLATEDRPTVHCDPNQLQQVLVNVATNAVQAMGQQGELCLTVGSGRLEGANAVDLGVQSGTFATIEVRDSGPGIPDEIIDRIFEPYFTTRIETGGCGMGLATCQGIMERHGGAISAENHWEGGALFRILIPVGGSAAERFHPVRTGRADWCGRILLVDDERMVLRATRRLLGRVGAQVVACEDPEEALELLRAEPTGFDLLLSDLSMPTYSGLELATRAQEIAPDLPALILTGNRSLVSQEEVRRAGVEGILEKPLASDELCEALSGIEIRTGAGARGQQD